MHVLIQKHILSCNNAETKIIQNRKWNVAAHTLKSWYSPHQKWNLNPQPLGYKTNFLIIRPQLPLKKQCEIKSHKFYALDVEDVFKYITWLSFANHCGPKKAKWPAWKWVLTAGQKTTETWAELFDLGQQAAT